MCVCVCERERGNEEWREIVDAKTTDNTCTYTQVMHKHLLAYSQTLERYHPLHHCGLLLVGEWA